MQRMPPQNAQSTPNMALDAHSGTPVSPGLARAITAQPAAAVAPIASGVASPRALRSENGDLGVTAVCTGPRYQRTSVDLSDRVVNCYYLDSVNYRETNSP